MDKTSECIYYNELFDLYGNLLNEREKEIFTLFYEEDLSLQEIADERGITKSAIGKTIQIVVRKLEDYESKLHFLAKILKVRDLLENEEQREKIIEIMKG